MSKIISYTILLLFLACFIVNCNASPLKDVATTTVEIEKASSPTAEHFVVTVNRVDDLFDDDTLLGERVMAVMMHFDIQGDKLHINNVPVELNTTSLEIVQAEVATGDKRIEDIDKSFDVGLVTVEVSTVVEVVPTEFLNVDVWRITISARIIEIDGNDVVQTDIIEKIMEVKVHNVLEDDEEGGELVSVEDINTSAPPANLGKVSKSNSQPIICPFKNRVDRVHQWWQSTSRFTRVVIASMCFTVVFGIMFILVPATVHYYRSQSRYEIISYNPSDESITQVIYIADEEKQELSESVAQNETK